ncbi:MAG TPA: RNA polymerase subunit sigma [Planctomycetes bacterium]|nr:RNA polymerase subunit sigma [Planctomycetota bacterium]HIK59080.1 RNA polymerase subunit sigma [Planctomycetota bacterium]
MGDPFPTQVTTILNGMSKEDSSTPEDFVALLYGELKQMAKIQMVRQRGDHTLQPTALVNEIWMRIQPESGKHSWESRRHFFRAAACAMRSVLVDHARGRQAAKRGGGEKPVPLNENIHVAAEDADSILELDGALVRLEAEDPDLAELVQLRFYAGMAHDEIADQLNVSVRTVERRWRAAKLWLLDDLSEEVRT